MPIMQRTQSQAGFTLIEVVMVIIIVGILSAVAVRQMATTVDTAKYEQTTKELDQLASAIRGNPASYDLGTRTDFGYVGDVGAFPPNLDALVQNPGAFTTWKGPYVDRGMGTNDFKTDGWGSAYSYTDTLLRSSGSGSNIDKLFAASHAELLSNSVVGYVLDANKGVPGSIYKDSVWIQLQHANGSGGLKIDSLHPNSDGYFGFSNLAVGNLNLKVIYTPAADTIATPVTVYPNRNAQLTVIFPADLW